MADRLHPQAARLAELAEKATPGPWKFWVSGYDDAGHESWHLGKADEPRKRPIADFSGWGEPDPCDRDFIAACDPQTIAALLAECDAQRERIQELEAGMGAPRLSAGLVVEADGAHPSSDSELARLRVECDAANARVAELEQALREIEAMDDGDWGEGPSTAVRKLTEAYALARAALRVGQPQETPNGS